jgi:hypothetical protein
VIRRTIPSQYYQREVAASDIANAIGLGDLVPATVDKDGPKGRGSVQKFIQDAPKAFESGNYFGNNDTDLGRAAAFDYLIGNTDRHYGNWLIKDNSKMILIDHGLSLPEHQTGDGQVSQCALLDQAYDKGMKIPEEVKNWKWNDIHNVLAEHGFNPKVIEKTKERYHFLQQHDDFKKLKMYSPLDYWNDSESLNLPETARVK